MADRLNVELYLGDCLDFMREMEPGSVDAVVTDPPYGIRGDYSSYEDSVDNLEKLVPSFIEEAKRVTRGVVAVFTGVKNTDLYYGCDWRLAWVRPAGTGIGPWGFTCWTPIAVFGKDPYSGSGRRPDVYVDYRGRRKGYDHPYEKPLGVVRWLIERVAPGQTTILDPFMGSGTTGEACLELGHSFIGCEIDPDYFAIAKKRIEAARAQLVLPL